MFEREDSLDKAGNTRRRIQVTDVGFDGADSA
jgi:hypothetical protein